ncbi:hypothetical protein LNQ52_18745 [Klebsiella pneumoniae subsp. pneumoniae]|nr:hypothetical protein [Klebsiella pneumoniae subsp. pneumoniae]
MMSNTLLESVVKKTAPRLIPFMLALYVLAFLDRSNIGFAKETYQLDTPDSAMRPTRWGPVSSLWSMPSSGCRPIC